MVSCEAPKLYFLPPRDGQVVNGDRKGRRERISDLSKGLRQRGSQDLNLVPPFPAVSLNTHHASMRQ